MRTVQSDLGCGEQRARVCGLEYSVALAYRFDFVAQQWHEAVRYFSWTFEGLIQIEMCLRRRVRGEQENYGDEENRPHHEVSRRTVELTRRRESKHPPRHQVSYKTRSRRSRPTICYAALSAFGI